MVCQLVVCFVIVFISEEDRDEGLSECWEFFSQIQEADGECDTSLQDSIGEAEYFGALKVARLEYFLADDGKDLCKEVLMMFFSNDFFDGLVMKSIE